MAGIVTLQAFLAAKPQNERELKRALECGTLRAILSNFQSEQLHSQLHESELLTAGCAALAPKISPLLALLVLAGPVETVWLDSPRQACAAPALHNNIPSSMNIDCLHSVPPYALAIHKLATTAHVQGRQL